MEKRAFSPVVAAIARSIIACRGAKQTLGFNHRQMRSFSLQLLAQRDDAEVFEELAILAMRTFSVGLVKVSAQLRILAQIGRTQDTRALLPKAVRTSGLKLPRAGVSLRRPVTSA